MNLHRRDHSAGDPQTPWDEVRLAIGDEAAARLARDFGGCMLYVRQSPGPHHPISVSIGQEKARQLGEEFGGLRIDVPLNPGKRALILDLLSKGWKNQRIAREVGCTERHVYAVKAEAKKAGPRAPDLFD